ncbi:hypothetical protein TNCV_4149051 [Trichonephila clavipes]|nr:hypothetical protein TNCV_4149051 [Trichonephila clavipes]
MLTTPLQTGSTVLSGQWDTHNRSACYSPPPSNVWQQFFGRSAFLRQQETDLPPAELWCACSFFADRTISVFCRRRTSNTTSPCRLLHIPVVLNDFHSRVKQRCERYRTPWQHLLFFALLRSFQ